MKATKQQKQLIAINTPNKDIKEEWVQWATEDVKKTSTNDLTFKEANLILVQLGLKAHKAENWAIFDKNNPKHKLLLALMYQASWTEFNGLKEIPDLERFSDWLKDKAPVKKALKDQDAIELEKTIKAFKGVINSRFR